MHLHPVGPRFTLSRQLPLPDKDEGRMHGRASAGGQQEGAQLSGLAFRGGGLHPEQTIPRAFPPEPLFLVADP